MLNKELIELIGKIQEKRCEEQHIELKKASKGCPQKLYDTISSFANQKGGGTIIFGIDEESDYAVTGVYNAQDLQKQVTEQCNQMSPIVRPLFTVAEINKKSVVSAEIQECEPNDKPCFYKGAGRLRGAFIRVGDSDMPMTEYEIYNFEVFRKKIHNELRVVERSDLSNLDKTKIDEYLFKVKKLKPNLAKLEEHKIFELQGITQNDKPTIAGMMLFGVYPQGFWPQLSVTSVVVPGTELGDTGLNGERFIDNKRFDGTLSEMLNESIAFINRNMQTSTIVKNGKRNDRTEYPIGAIREIVLNALIHRDYSIYTENSPIRIAMYSDRLEISNPGGLFGRVTLETLGKSGADTRNPYLANMLEILSETENRFSGIPTILKEMQQHNLPPPLFENVRGEFKVTLFNDNHKNFANKTAHGGKTKDRILKFCEIPRSREDIAQHFNAKSVAYFTARYIIPLVEDGTLKLTIPDKPKSKNQRFVASKMSRM